MAKKRQIKQTVRDFGTQGSEVVTYTSGQASYGFNAKISSPAHGHKSAQKLELDLGNLKLVLSGRQIQTLKYLLDRHGETYDYLNDY